MPTPNLVPFQEPGLAVALQWWEGDREQACRLAHLLAEIETHYRADVTLVLCGRWDTDAHDVAETVAYCNRKMRTFALTIPRRGAGHPAGSNALWAGTMDVLSRMWRDGDLEREDVFTIEADGCPLSTEWIDRLLGEHQLAKDRGKRVTGAFMPRPLEHINGSLVASLPWWIDTPSLNQTPEDQSWDVFHRMTILAAAMPSSEIRNIYGAVGWRAEQLGPLGKQASWLASTKDESAIAWAEETLAP